MNIQINRNDKHTPERGVIYLVAGNVFLVVALITGVWLISPRENDDARDECRYALILPLNPRGQ